MVNLVLQYNRVVKMTLVKLYIVNGVICAFAFDLNYMWFRCPYHCSTCGAVLIEVSPFSPPA